MKQGSTARRRAALLMRLIFSLAVVLCATVFLGVRGSIRSFKVGSVVLSILLVLMIIITASSTFKERMSTALDLNQPTANARITLYFVGAKMFLRHPLFGVGAKMFADRCPEITDWCPGVTSHNIFITVAAELGIGGIICFLLLLFYTFKDNWIVYKRQLVHYPTSRIAPMALGLFISVFAFAVGGNFQTVLYYPPPYFIIGLSVALKRLAEREGMLAKEQVIQKKPHHARIQPLIYNTKPGHIQLDRQR